MDSIDSKPARTRLLQDQLPDGRVAISPQHPQAYWPTSLAVLAWDKAPEFRAAQTKAIQFLCSISGKHLKKKSNSPSGHDPFLKGWPWIDGSHAWVIPSALAALALREANFSQCDRVRETIHLLLDRQLPQGGWNYGNTTVFGQELHPMVQNTGVALCALAGSVPVSEVNASLLYLKNRVVQVRTPLSLSWGLLGLGAWALRPVASANCLEACWNLQERYGPYDTIALSLMLLVNMNFLAIGDVDSDE